MHSCGKGHWTIENNWKQKTTVPRQKFDLLDNLMIKISGCINLNQKIVSYCSNIYNIQRNLITQKCMGYAKLCYELLWPAITHNDLKHSYYDPLWPKAWEIVLQWSKIPNTRTFYFPKYCPQNTCFWENLVPKLEKVLFKMKLDRKGHSRLKTLNLTIVSLNFGSKMPFLGSFGRKTSKNFA